ESSRGGDRTRPDVACRAGRLSPAAACRDPADGIFERAAAGADLWHPVVLARRNRGVVDDDRALWAGAHLLQSEIPVVAADRPPAAADLDRPARPPAQLGVDDPGVAGGRDPRPRLHRPARRPGPDRACRGT